MESLAHYCSNPNLQATKSVLQPSSHYLGLKSRHLPKPSFSLKSQFGSFRTRPQASSLKGLHVIEESFYSLLGISENGSLSEIKQAYKQLVRKYHPDVSPPECIEEHIKRFIQVQEAYETLSDPNTRALYDRDMSKGLRMAFSARQRPLYKDLDESSQWKNRWQAQLRELERRSMNKDFKENASWAARIRRQSCRRHTN